MNRKSLSACLFSALVLAGCGEIEQNLSERAGEAVGDSLAAFFSEGRLVPA